MSSRDARPAGDPPRPPLASFPVSACRWRAVRSPIAAYCECVWARYGRFPAYQPPMRTLLGFQVNHLDCAFYDRHYKPGR